MNNVNKTLYIPLYGKAYVSRRGIILHDPKAEQIWQQAGFPLKGKAKSKWLAFFMGMRSKVFDEWAASHIEDNTVVLHIGCGMDSRTDRLGVPCAWFDIDFPAVIHERQKHYTETDRYKMIPADAIDPHWLSAIPHADHAVVILEGVCMYLSPVKLQDLLARLDSKYPKIDLLMDCYSSFAAKMSRYKNPINEVGVTRVYGTDDSAALQSTNLRFVKQHDMTPPHLIDQLKGFERTLFEKLYAGKFARKLYKMFEFAKK